MNKVESALQRTTDTKALVIGVGTLPRTAEMFNELFPGCRAVVVADTNTWRVAGGEVHRILADAGIGQDEPHVFADPKLYAEWSFIEELDVVAVNKYMGWYHPWPLTPDKAVWDVARGKPLIISEFGGEARYGQHGPADVASSWSEEYQEALYRDNLRMFENIPNLRGVSPWILFDFRSPFRFHPANQEGWNRKGLVSDQGYRKKAWYLMKAYYDKH